MIFRFRVLFAFTFACCFLVATFQSYQSRRYQAALNYQGSSYRLFDSTAHLPLTDYAIATFLTGQANDDSYFTATRVLTHQLTHAPATQSNSSHVTFLVLCSQSVSHAQKK